MNQQDIFASAQIIMFNPILKETADIRVQYFRYLRKLLRDVRWDKRKYTKAQIKFYKDILCNEQEGVKYNKDISFDARFCYLLPYDLAVMLGFHPKVVKSEKIKTIINKIILDFHLPKTQATIFSLEFQAALGSPEAWEEIFKSILTKEFQQYLKLVKTNISFINKKPYGILITATMSAGKSTLINALTGKNISLVQNMSCTSKIHTIISKSKDDGISSEYDYDISIAASKEDLLDDNGENKSYRITVGTFFNGELGGKRIVLMDSPGVNSSENAEHAEITQQMIESQRYHLMIYVLNSTQLGTTDEERHLENVKQKIGETKMIFVMNKVDQLISEDEDYIDAIEDQRKFLISKGFNNPVICPVSSRAAYLVKKSKTAELSRIERRELENYMDKFEMQSLSDYYEKTFGCLRISINDETDALFVNCGFAHFEKIITNLYNGGSKNGTGIC